MLCVYDAFKYTCEHTHTHTCIGGVRMQNEKLYAYVCVCHAIVAELYAICGTNIVCTIPCCMFCICFNFNNGLLLAHTVHKEDGKQAEAEWFGGVWARGAETSIRIYVRRADVIMCGPIRGRGAMYGFCLGWRYLARAFRFSGGEKRGGKPNFNFADLHV